MILQVTRGAMSLGSSTHFPTSESPRFGESTSNGSPCASRQNQDFRSGEPPCADQPATRSRFNCIRGRSLLRPAPGFREPSKAPRACELRADEPIRTYGSCHHADGSSPSDLRDCDRAPLNVLSSRACACTYPRHSPAFLIARGYVRRPKTTKMSITTVSVRWLRRNLRQVRVGRRS
jgi:hypothetical protein